MFFDREKFGVGRSLEDTLKSISLFEDLSEETIDCIAKAAQSQDIERGTQLITAGDSAEDFFVVVRGKFSVEVKNSVVAEVEPGELIGEIAFFAGGTRTADVIAMRASEVLRFDRPTYDTLAKDYPDIALGIIASLARRVAASNTVKTARQKKKKKKSRRRVGLMAVRDGTIPQILNGQVKEVVNELPEWDILIPDNLPDGFVAAGADAVIDWLDGEDNTKDSVLLICETPSRQTVWREVIEQVCETIFLVGPAEEALHGPVPLSEIEKSVFEKVKRQNLQLVLWRENKGERPQKTPNWLKQRPVKLHHHVGLNANDDFARLADFIQGKSFDVIF